MEGWSRSSQNPALYNPPPPKEPEWNWSSHIRLDRRDEQQAQEAALCPASPCARRPVGLKEQRVSSAAVMEARVQS